MTEPLTATRLPPNSQYVRITVSEKTVEYLNPTSYDRVLYDDATFEAEMAKSGAREPLSAEPRGRPVVRLRGGDATRHA